MKLCIDCKHYQGSECCHALNMGKSLVTGEDYPRQSAHYLRTADYCGTNAKWFEPKEPAVAVPLEGSAA